MPFGSITKKLKRARDAVFDPFEGVQDAVASAKDYLAGTKIGEQVENVVAGGGGRGGYDVADYLSGLGSLAETTGVTEAARKTRIDDLIAAAAARVDEQAPGVSKAAGAVFRGKPGQAAGRNPFVNVWNLSNDITELGGAVAGEPVVYGARRAFGTAEPGDSPWSGMNRALAARELEDVGGPGKYAGLAGLGALSFATDPQNWLPSKAAAGIGAQIGARIGSKAVGRAVALGVETAAGGVGTGSVASRLGAMALLGGGFGAGAGITSDITDNPLVQTGAGLAGAIVAGGAPSAGRALISRGATKEASVIAKKAEQVRQVHGIPTPDIGSDIRELGAGLRPPPGYVRPFVTGTLAGAGIGAAVNEDNRAEGASYGAGIGGLGAIGGKFTWRHGTVPAARKVQAFFSEASVANPTVRQGLWQAARMEDAIRTEIDKVRVPEAELAWNRIADKARPAYIDPSIARLDPVAERSRLETAWAKDIDTHGPPVRDAKTAATGDGVVLWEDAAGERGVHVGRGAKEADSYFLQAKRVVGSMDDIIEHPDLYGLGIEHPELYGLGPGLTGAQADAWASVATLKKHYDDIFAEELAAGRWDRARNDLQKAAFENINDARKERARALGAYDRAKKRADIRGREGERLAAALEQIARRDIDSAGAARGTFGQGYDAAGRARGDRMTPLMQQAVTFADQAVSGAEAAFARRASEIANRLGRAGVRLDAAVNRGEAAGKVARAGREAGMQAAIDEFRQVRASLPPLEGRQRQRMDWAIRKMEKSLEKVAAVDDVRKATADLTTIAIDIDRVYQGAYKVARGATPAIAEANLARLHAVIGKKLDAEIGRQIQRVERGASVLLGDAATAFEKSAKLTDKRAAQVRARAAREQASILHKAAGGIAKAEERAIRLEDKAVAQMKKRDMPVEQYIPHMPETTDLAFWGGKGAKRPRQVGAKQSSEFARAYVDVAAAAADRATPMLGSPGEKLRWRGEQHARIMADAHLMKILADELKTANPVDAFIIPDFSVDAIVDALGKGDRAAGLRAFDRQYAPLDIGIVFKNTKDPTEVAARITALGSAVIDAGHFPPGMDKAARGELRATVNKGDVRFFMEKHAANIFQKQFKEATIIQGQPGKIIDEVAGTFKATTLGFDLFALMRLGPQAALSVAGAAGLSPKALARMTAEAAVGGGIGYAVAGEEGAAVGAGIGLARLPATPAAKALVRSFTGDLFKSADDRLWLPHIEISPDRRDFSRQMPEGGLAIERGYTPLQRAGVVGVGAGIGYLYGGEEGAAIGAGAGLLVPTAFKYVNMPLESWQFAKFIPALKIETAKAIYGILGSRQVEKLTRTGLSRVDAEYAVRADIGSRVDTVISGFSRIRAGVSRDAEFYGRHGLISAPWLRGIFKNMTDVTKPTLEGRLARGFFLSAAVGAVGLSALSAAIFLPENDINLDTLTRLLDPRERESVTNPDSSNFLKVVLPDGEKLDIWGPLSTPMKALLQPIGKGIGAAAEADEEGLSVEEAFREGMKAWAGAQGDAPTNFAFGRLGVIPSTVIGLVKNEDFRGREISHASDFGSKVGDQLKWVTLQYTPGVGRFAVSDNKGAIPEWDTSQWGATRDIAIKRAGAAIVGVQYNPGRDVRPEVEEPVRKFLLQNGIAPGSDPIGTYNATDRIDRIARSKFEQDNPQIGAYRVAQRQVRSENVAKPKGGDAANEYYHTKDILDTERKGRLDALYAAFNAPTSRMRGDDFRKQRAEIMSDHAAKVEAIGTVFLGAGPYADRQKKLDEIYSRDGARPPVSDRDRMLEALESIEPVDASSEQTAVYSDRRRKLLTSGVLTDEAGRTLATFAPAVAADVRDYVLTKNPDPNERAYQRSLEAFQDYQAISPYLIYDTAQSRRIAAANRRAAEIQDRIPGIDKVTAIILDRDSTMEDKARAIVVASNPDLRNPRKRLFYDANVGRFGRYWSELGAEAYSEFSS